MLLTVTLRLWRFFDHVLVHVSRLAQPVCVLISPAQINEKRWWRVLGREGTALIRHDMEPISGVNEHTASRGVEGFCAVLVYLQCIPIVVNVTYRLAPRRLTNHVRQNDT